MEYLNLVMNRAREKGVKIIFMDILNQLNPQLVQIDNYVNNLYFSLRNHVASPEMSNLEAKKLYLLILVSIKYSVECEQRFPYLPDPSNMSRKFNWNNFYGDHESSSIYDLSSKI